MLHRFSHVRSRVVLSAVFLVVPGRTLHLGTFGICQSWRRRDHPDSSNRSFRWKGSVQFLYLAGRSQVRRFPSSFHFENFPEDIQCQAQVLTTRLDEIKQARIERLTQLDLQLGKGSLERGRRFFFSKEIGCSGCHTIGAEGNEVGPDLTSVGAIRSRHDLLEAIIFPSASFVPGHEVRRVKTAGERYTGIVGGWERSAEGDGDSDVLVLVTGPNARVRIPRSEIVSMEASPVSLMPEGLGDALSRDQLADIVTFLQAQKQLSDQNAGAVPESH